MPANRKLRREFDLDAFRDQAIEALGQTPGLKLNMPSGDPVVIPHPMLVSDDRQAQIEHVQRRDDEDRDENGEPNGKVDGEFVPWGIRFAKAILGEQEHARFLAAGGSSQDISLAWQYLTDGLKKDPKSET
jgi:hypothetical protein